MATADKLIREIFELDRDAMYAGHRLLYVNDPRVVQAYPDPLLREQALLDSWRQSTESHYQGYREACAEMSADELVRLQGMLKRMIATERFHQILAAPPGNNGHAQEASKTRDTSRGM